MQFLDIHTHQERKYDGVQSILSLSLTQGIDKFPEDQALSVGLHPWFATTEHLETDYLRLLEVAKENRVKMIGECGLDRLKGESLETNS